MNSFQKCIRPIVERWRNNVEAINGRWENTGWCDRVFRDLDIVPMENLHETKWTILPTCKEENIMVTLGVGHDTMAEEKLNKTLKDDTSVLINDIKKLLTNEILLMLSSTFHQLTTFLYLQSPVLQTLPNTRFFGADPIIEPNRQLYSAFGKFFPFAIGKKPGFTKFRVLPNQNQKTRTYEFQDVTTIPFTYFLSDILGLKRIDIAWIDIEGGEFEFLDQIPRDGPMDQKGISICQFNLEIHSKFHPPGALIFHDFVFKVLEDRRYVFLRPARTEPGVHRMFFVNLEDKECVRKFLQ
uniref:Methyltransf_21 domain-containing protein n=1 Tax=Caenorhabditis tropicalis TaxID=1561998 RepID=A0A1I7T2P7_9PELO